MIDEKDPYFPNMWDAHPKKLERFGVGEDGIIVLREPITLIQVALDLWNDNQRALFDKYANEIIKNIEDNGNFAGIPYTKPFKLVGYSGFPKTWQSGMTNGMLLSVLKRAGKHELGNKVIESFNYDVSDGGVRTQLSEGVWFDEFTSEKRGHVLNGMMYALLGLYDFGTPKAKQLFCEGVDCLTKKLGDYEFCKGMSRYDDNRMFWAGKHYHSVHYRQLFEISEITGDDFFKRVGQRWKSEHEEEYLTMALFDFPIRAILKAGGVLL